ncbi:restriction endonuclease subunit S [Pedobacter sp. JCM 36344]|uniref:restriction endonuclease subunit S n=1 Tax=Pedobacter sp. JCM 36344 TaxID=3374280 RepID=UPI00397A4B00
MIEFGEFAELEKGKYVPVANEHFRCLELEHFEQGTGHILGWVNSSEQKSTKNKFKNGHVLFGKLRPYLQKYWLAQYDGVCSSEVWVLNSKNKKCCNNFLFRIVQSGRFIQVANVSSGSKMPRADWGYVSSFPFLIPPIPEQLAITHILDLIDRAIQKNNQLIAQKELRKKWLMQQLLTGKKRLMGFNGEWKENKLEYFIKEYKQKPSEFHNYNILTSAKAGLIMQTDYYGDNRITNRDDADYNVIPPNHLTYRSRSDDGLFTFNKNDSGLTGLISGYYPVFTIINGDIDFIWRYINYYRQKLTKYAIGTSQLVLSINALKEAKFHLPNLEEQRAIGRVLQAADKEIHLLKAKTEQLQEQKKGLMQVLLTGKKRLN